MIIVMKPDATKENIQKVEERLHQVGLKAHLSTGEDCTIIGVIGDRKKIANLEVSMLEGVEKTVRITEKYKLVSRHFHPEDTIVDVDGVKIGGKEVVVMAGPCSVESEEQFNEVAECIASLGLHWIRGGAFKPRTNPHSFQGLGEEALQIMKAGGDKYGLKTLTEVMDSEHCEMVHSYVDGLQVGARNFQNFSLLKNIGKVTKDSHKMVLFKRGFAGTIAEWLAATDYITMAGNDNVVLCERGLRTFETATRFTLDISAVPVIHKQSLYPICVDVSHPAGVRDLVPALARAAVAVGADSIMIEVHPNPPAALSDGPQQLTPAQFTDLIAELRELAAVFGKKIV